MRGNHFFSIYLFLIGISAVVGGYNLIMSNGSGMSVALLNNSPFTSYFWPGVILALVVGGTHLAAAVSLWTKFHYSPEVAAISGFGLLIWIFTELNIIGQSHWLQILYFGLGIITIITSILLIRFTEKPDTNPTSHDPRPRLLFR
jgi:hypothetical protein